MRVRKKRFNFLDGMVIRGFECPYASAKNFRNFLVLHILKIFHIKNHPLLFGQMENRSLQHLLRFIPIKIAVTLQFVEQGLIEFINRQVTGRSLPV